MDSYVFILYYAYATCFSISSLIDVANMGTKFSLKLFSKQSFLATKYTLVYGVISTEIVFWTFSFFIFPGDFSPPELRFN